MDSQILLYMFFSFTIDLQYEPLSCFMMYGGTHTEFPCKHPPHLIYLLPRQVQADGLAGDVDGRRRGHVEDALGRRPRLVRHGARRPRGDAAAAAAAAAGQVPGLRDGAVALALLDERLVGGTGTGEQH